MSFTAIPLPKPSKNLISIQSISKEVSLTSDNKKNDKDQQSIQKKVQNQKVVSKKEEEIKQKDPPKGNIIHVSNISTKLSYQQIKKGLYNLFSIHGPIFQIIIKTKESGQHFAFIDFPDIKDAEKAINAARTEGKRLENKLLIVNYCEDPKKNEARKDQKCFLCHSTGHKAIKCPVKPDMIKKKPKKLEDNSSQQETNCIEIPIKAGLKKIQPVQQKNEKQSQSESSEQEPKQRDRDYLRFLKLKKKLLQKKLQKKIKKSKKKK